MGTNAVAAERGIRHGVSTAPQAADAVEELFAAIGQPSMGFVAVFCSPLYDRAELQKHLARRFAGATLVGCTTSGEVSHLGYTDGGLSGVSIAREYCFAVAQLLPNVSEFQPSEGREVSVALLQEVKRMGGQPSSLNTFGFLLVDGMSFMEERVISALSTGLGTIPVFGGSAGDGRRHHQTFVLHEGRFHADAAVLTLVHTRLPFKVFSTSHFVGTDQQAIVTAADPDRRIVFELNGESAALEYAQLIGCRVDDMHSDHAVLPPLVVRIGGAFYARSIERVNADGSLQLACAIDEGVPLSLARNTGMLTNLCRVFEDVRHVVGRPQVVIGIDCFMRRVEAKAAGITAEVADVFREQGVIGFSAYGEQFNAMHLNHTLTGVAIGWDGGGQPLVAMPPVEGEVERLEHENSKLRKTVRVLLQRAERSMNVPGDTFSLFQNNVLLEETVRKRTEELAELNRQLNHELIKRREVEAALIQAKSEAEQANHSKTQFLAAISHDLQQPLNSARLLLGALAEELPAPGGRGLAARIEGALEMAEEMVADFLDVARLEAGAIACHPSTFPIGPLLAQLAAEYLPQARRRGLSLSFVPTTAAVRTDRHLLQRILRNLLSNALRYTPRGGILLGCRRRKDQLSIEVWDTGIGIPQAHQREVFRAFCRLDGGRPSGERGAGLGLTIVERIAQVLDVPIRLRSREGKGSGFMIELPSAAMTAVAGVGKPPAPPSVQSPLVGKRILALDDDPGAAAALVRLLQAWGCEAVAATTLEAAMAMLSPIPDLIIADYHLAEGQTGLDAVARLQGRLNAPVPALIVSADASPSIRSAVREAGYEFLVKPINPARLRSVASYLFFASD